MTNKLKCPCEDGLPDPCTVCGEPADGICKIDLVRSDTYQSGVDAERSRWTNAATTTRDFTVDERTAIEWLQRNLSYSLDMEIKFTSDQERCVAVLSSIARLHNLNIPTTVHKSVTVEDGFVSCLINGELATYDDSALTRLVIAAHAHAVRVAVVPWVSHLDDRRSAAIAAHYLYEHVIEIDPDAIPGIMEVRLSARRPGAVEGAVWEGHPMMRDLMADV